MKRALGKLVLSFFSALMRGVPPCERVQIYLREIRRALSSEEQRMFHRDELAHLIQSEEQMHVPSLKVGKGPDQDRFYAYQRGYVPFNIHKGAKVLDVGPGGHPFPYATHLADLYEDQTTHRAEPLRTNGLPLLRCDIERMPYRDHEFDFVYCSHVLEHVNNPALACEELMRVGKRGYIETPTRLSDVMLNFTRLVNHHRWYISLLGTTLVFMEWPDKERRDTGSNDFFLMLHSRYQNAFQDLFHNQRDLFANMLLWEKQFTYFVFSKDGALLASNGEQS